MSQKSNRMTEGGPPPRALVRYITRPTDVFSVHVFFPAGSLYDPPRQEGLAHFAEHMKFRRTRDHTSRSLNAVLDSMGSHNNAVTTRDVTTFYIKTLQAHAHRALSVLAEVTYGSEFHHNHLDTERHIVIDEIRRYYDDPDSAIMEDAEASLLDPRDPYARSVAGVRASLQTITNHDLAAYDRAHFRRAPLSVWILVGPAARRRDSLRYLRRQLRTFGGVNMVGSGAGAGAVVAWAPLPRPLLSLRPSVLYRERPGMAHTSVVLTCPAPPRPAGIDSYRMNLLAYVLMGTLDSLFVRYLREVKGYVYSIQGHNNAYAHRGFFHIVFKTAAAHIVPIIEWIRATLADAPRVITPARFAKAKRSYMESIQFTLSSPDAVCRTVGIETVYNVAFDLDAYLKTLAATRREDVLRLIAEWLTGDMAAVVYGPVSEEVLAEVQGLMRAPNMSS